MTINLKFERQIAPELLKIPIGILVRKAAGCLRMKVNLKKKMYNWVKIDQCLVLLWAQNDFGPSKLFWSTINHFGRAQFVLFGFKSVWTGPNYKK